MPIKRIKKILSIINSGQKKLSRKPKHQKYGFIIFENNAYDYILIDVPRGYAVDKAAIGLDNPVIEMHLVNKETNEKFLKSRVATLNRRWKAEQKGKK